jgi:hypothetical protein
VAIAKTWKTRIESFSNRNMLTRRVIKGRKSVNKLN